ncbi:MAG: hypothetical protein DBX55_07000 [Verrucomicrobia bacterium]|nr:MAG: hypothetical protein DBX55_07000 [Verrucomicrobiota bacterium]
MRGFDGAAPKGCAQPKRARPPKKSAHGKCGGKGGVGRQRFQNERGLPALAVSFFVFAAIAGRGLGAAAFLCPKFSDVDSLRARAV